MVGTEACFSVDSLSPRKPGFDPELSLCEIFNKLNRTGTVSCGGQRGTGIGLLRVV